MLYSELIAVCSQIHTKHINTLCGQNVELPNIKLAVHKVATGSCRAAASFITFLAIIVRHIYCYQVFGSY